MNLYDGITVEIDNSQDVIEITNSTEDLIIACVQGHWIWRNSSSTPW